MQILIVELAWDAGMKTVLGQMTLLGIAVSPTAAQTVGHLVIVVPQLWQMGWPVKLEKVSEIVCLPGS